MIPLEQFAAGVSLIAQRHYLKTVACGFLADSPHIRTVFTRDGDFWERICHEQILTHPWEGIAEVFENECAEAAEVLSEAMAQRMGIEA
jgi:hypothetical protein